MKKNLRIFDDPGNVKLFLRIFFISLGVLLFSEFFIHKHGHFSWEEKPFFFAVYGFVSCVLLIFIAKLIRLMVKRDEDYYDKD